MGFCLLLTHTHTHTNSAGIAVANQFLFFLVVSSDLPSLPLPLPYPVFMLEGSPAGSDSDHLVTKVSLDRERVSVHIVTILVSDAGSPQKNSTAVMTLTLTDVNDNVPVWTTGQGSEFEIFEVQFYSVGHDGQDYILLSH